jgi:hypothetical protein
MDSETKELLTQAYRAAPTHIRKFIDSGKLEAFVRELQVSAGLHVDQADVVARELLMMILGIEDPNTFISTLQNELGLEPSKLDRIVADINNKIFIPLRRETEAALASVPPEKKKPVIPSPSSAVVQKEISKPTSLKPIIPTLPTHLKPVLPPTPPAAPPMRTMEHDVEEMKEGKAPLPFIAPPVAPTPTAAPAPRPQPVTPPTPSSTPTEQEVHDTLKQYGIDPYREPVE